MVSRRDVFRAVSASTIVMAVNSRQGFAEEVGTPSAESETITDLFHNDLPDLPEATEGEIEVVLTGHTDGNRPAFLIHNATDTTVGLTEITGVATLEDGSQLDTVGFPTTAPYELIPGGYAIGVARLEDSIPASTEVEFEYEIPTEEPGSDWVQDIELSVIEIEIDGDRVSGSVENHTDEVASELVSVVGLFFGPDGEIAGWFYRHLLTDVDPGETGRFGSTDVYGEITASYLIAASGPAG